MARLVSTIESAPDEYTKGSMPCSLKRVGDMAARRQSPLAEIKKELKMPEYADWHDLALVWESTSTRFVPKKTWRNKLTRQALWKIASNSGFFS